MRTTIDIDEDVLITVKEIAMSRGTSAGKVVSELTRKALLTESTDEVMNGVPIFPRRSNGKVVTMELVNKLRDEE